jgi:hypothetical protein
MRRFCSVCSTSWQVNLPILASVQNNLIGAKQISKPVRDTTAVTPAPNTLKRQLLHLASFSYPTAGNENQGFREQQHRSRLGTVTPMHGLPTQRRNPSISHHPIDEIRETAPVKRRGNAPVSHSGGASFESQPGHRLSWLSLSWFPSRQMPS